MRRFYDYAMFFPLCARFSRKITSGISPETPAVFGRYAPRAGKLPAILFGDFKIQGGALIKRTARCGVYTFSQPVYSEKFSSRIATYSF